MRKKNVKAFVTIEYSLLLPVLLLLFTFLVYIGVYLHNQCVLQTNVYLLAVKGARAEAESIGERIAHLQEQEKMLYKNKYLLAENIQTNYSAQRNKLVITGSGQMVNPFFASGTGGAMWQMFAESTFCMKQNIQYH